MREITVPKLNNNDEAYTLTEWLVDDGTHVMVDAPIVVVETSKAAEELVAEHEGVVHRLAKESAECGIGAVIGWIFPTEEERQAYISAPPAQPSSQMEREPVEVVITNAARDAAQEYGVDLTQLQALGKPVVRRHDVEALVADRARNAPSPETGEILKLSRAQQAIAKVVMRSHETIPAAYIAMKIPVDAALKVREELSERSQLAVGLPELLVKAVAALRERFPLIFASPQADGSARLVEGAHVGVTLDVGQGMYIPVVKDAQTKSISQIADALMDFRISALRGQFAESDLSGGNIAISLHNDADVVIARPIIYPEHACILCLCGIQEELHLAAGGEIRQRSHVNVGLGYDHRLINGRDATLFLQELKALLAGRDELLKLVT